MRTVASVLACWVGGGILGIAFNKASVTLAVIGVLFLLGGVVFILTEDN